MNTDLVNYLLETVLPGVVALAAIGFLSLNLFFRKKRPAAVPLKPPTTATMMTPDVLMPAMSTRMVADDFDSKDKSSAAFPAAAQRTHVSSQTFQKRFFGAVTPLEPNGLTNGPSSNSCAFMSNGVIGKDNLVVNAASQQLQDFPVEGHILKGNATDALPRGSRPCEASIALPCSVAEVKQRDTGPVTAPTTAEPSSVAKCFGNKIASIVNGMTTADSKKTPAQKTPTTKLASATDSFVQNHSILKLTEQLVLATAKCDLEAFERLSDKDMTSFTYETQGNLVRGLQFPKFFIQAGVTQRVSSTVRSFLYNPRITLLGPDAACITYTSILQYVNRNGMALTRESLETRIWKMVNEQWTCVHFHQSAGSLQATATTMLE